MSDQKAPLERQFGDVRVPVLIVTAGLPGSGKSTIAEIIAGRLGATAISVDPIEGAILKAGIDSDQPTGLAAYLVAERMAEQVLVSGHSVVVDAVNADVSAFSRGGTHVDDKVLMITKVTKEGLVSSGNVSPMG